MSLGDDIVYLSLLLASIAIGHLLRRSVAAPWRKSCSSVLGLAMLFAVSGRHSLYCLVACLVQIVSNLAVPHRYLHVWSFVVQFAYLLFFRLAGDYFSDHLNHPPPHTNAIQMILTLKMIGVAFEIHDSVEVERRRATADGALEDDDVLFLEHKYIRPGPADIFHYAFSHAGLLTGPYYKYRTFKDLYDKKYSGDADCVLATWKRFQRIPVYIAGFLISGYTFPLKAVEDEHFYETTSFLYRLAYMTPIFFNFRMRLYTGFALSECSCIMAGLGAYPKSSRPKPGAGPTLLSTLDQIDKNVCSDSVEYDFETVHNIDEYKAEFVSSFREGLKTWNMTVQHWLAVIVYRRFPIKPIRTLAVMIVSSVWHGVYSGYYLSLGSVPFVLVVEDLFDKVLRRNLSDTGKIPYDWLNWFLRMQMFSYLGMAFQLLRIDTTMTFWRSVAFVGHTMLPICYVLGLYVVKPLMGKTKSA